MQRRQYESQSRYIQTLRHSNLIMLRLCLSLVLFVSISFSQFILPVPVLQALKPKGFKITIKDRPDIEAFTFHGRINDAISSNISASVRQQGGKLVYYDPDLQLKVRDVVNYWFYVEANRAGYVQSDKKWEVKKLDSFDGEGCANPSTVTSFTDKDLCAGSVFFEDNFNGRNIDSSLWTVEQYIASYTEGKLEFVSYEDVNECRFLSNSNLFLKPVSRHEVRGELDFRGKCTRSKSETCYYKQFGAFILPPVKSAKITSKMTFKYGKVEIRAKLPLGDWVFPQIELIPMDSSREYPKILMAYARGNDNLTLPNGFDMGSRSLWGGYINLAASREPQWSQSLIATQLSSPVGHDMHVFTVTWTPKKIEFMVDDKVYGEILEFDTPDEYRISLGVGVGGVLDFPDGIQSFRKPWINFDSKQMKTFTDARSSWISTWIGNNVALQVDYVRVSAV